MTAAYTIASGPNPLVNALDMIVLATLSRSVMEDYWRKELYGERAAHLLEVHRGLEQESWSLVQNVLDSGSRVLRLRWTEFHDTGEVATQWPALDRLK